MLGTAALCWVWLGRGGGRGLWVHLLWLLRQHHGLGGIRQRTLILSEVPNVQVSGVDSPEAGLGGGCPASPGHSGNTWPGLELTP